MKEKEQISRQQPKIPEDERKKYSRQRNAFCRRADTRNCLSKNICEEAGVSNGSFYHHFKTKDDLLSYYIEDQPQIEPNHFGTSGQRTSSKRRYYPSVFELCKILP